MKQLEHLWYAHSSHNERHLRNVSGILNMQKTHISHSEIQDSTVELGVYHDILNIFGHNL